MPDGRDYEEYIMIEINGKTRTCGLLGDPVEHTKSPNIHNTLAELTGHNIAYVPFLVRQENIESALRGAYDLNILGMNATVPHKSVVIPFLKEIDPLAEKIGAVNTLVRVDGGYKGYNTDMTGLLRALKSEGIDPAQKKVIILGAGGAARAVAYLCASLGANPIYLLNRSVEKAVKIADEVNKACNSDIIPMALDKFAEIPGEDYLCLQCTSVGLHPNVDEVVIEADAFYEKVSEGFDLIYKPEETKFMKLVKAHGGKAYNGLKMLLYQGIDAYELWNDCKVTEEQAEVVRKVLLQA